MPERVLARGRDMGAAQGPVSRLLQGLGPSLARRFGTARDAARAAQRAQQEIAQGHWEDAILLSRMAIAADPTLPDGYRHLGFALLRSGDPTTARETYQAGLRIAPRDPWLARSLGNLELELGRNVAAERAYRQALGEQPEDASLLHKLGVAIGRQGRQERFEEATDLLERSIQRAPENAEALQSLGLVRYWMGDWPRAADALRRTIEHEPTNPDAHYYLGAALTKMEQWQEALHTITRAVALDPNNTAASQLHAWLEHQVTQR